MAEKDKHFIQYAAGSSKRYLSQKKAEEHYLYTGKKFYKQILQHGLPMHISKVPDKLNITYPFQKLKDSVKVFFCGVAEFRLIS